MWKSRVLFLIIWIVLSIVYVMDGSYEMGFVLGFYLVLHAVGGVLCLLGGRSLKLKIELPYSLEKEKAGEGRLVVKNQSMIPVMRGMTTLSWENTLTGEKGKSKVPFGVLPKGTSETSFLASAVFAGEYRFHVSEVRIFDLFGIFSGKRKETAKNAALVFPRGEEIEVSIFGKDAYDMESFRYSEEIKGDDSSETFNIREYMAGDSMRKIHWKLTGKLDNIMVKESSFPIFNSIMVILETGYEQETMPEPAAMDAALEVFLSAADMLVRQDMPFELGYYDYEKEFFCSERIESTEELWNMVPALLKAGRAQAANSAYYQYQLNCGDRRFAHYLYVAADGSFADVELAGEAESITILRCGEAAVRDGNKIIFTIENWKEELA